MDRRYPVNRRLPNHINAFIDLNQIPYLLGEYLDRRQFRQIDRAVIKNGLEIKNIDSMRSLIDINIDDIGKRADDLPQIRGNTSKQSDLIQMLRRNRDVINHRLITLRPGIVVRIDYQLENQRTKQILRTSGETFRIMDRHCFIDINPRDLQDNGVITHFASQKINSITEFLRGSDRMLMRILSIRLFYEGVKRDGMNAHGATFYPQDYDAFVPNPATDPNLYEYHTRFQNRHEYGRPRRDPLYPPGWLMFSRFYHFENAARDIVLHFQEIDDRMNRAFLVPCGIVNVNRAFIVNSGQRVIFRISIWKNDLTVVSNTQDIARALGVQDFGPPRRRRRRRDGTIYDAINPPEFEDEDPYEDEDYEDYYDDDPDPLEPEPPEEPPEETSPEPPPAPPTPPENIEGLLENLLEGLTNGLGGIGGEVETDSETDELTSEFEDIDSGMSDDDLNDLIAELDSAP